MEVLVRGESRLDLREFALDELRRVLDAEFPGKLAAPAKKDRGEVEADDIMDLTSQTWRVTSDCARDIKDRASSGAVLSEEFGNSISFGGSCLQPLF
jgi:hypothetical protein